MTSKAFGLAQLGNAYSDGALSNRNKIINGAMTIDQRNAGASVALGGSSVFPVDRMLCFGRAAGTGITGQRSTVAPAGYTNSLLYTVTTGVASTGADYPQIGHVVEGFNAADFGFGTANAQIITISFWVRSSITGTYGFSVLNGALDRSYVAQYTVSAANTWEYKTITVPGDTSGTWATNNTAGLRVVWDMGFGFGATASPNTWQAGQNYSVSGNVKLSETTGATFYLTGVQLEAGDTATPFEHRSYGQELALCMRYFYKLEASDTFFAIKWQESGQLYDNRYMSEHYLKTQMRANPTCQASASSAHFMGVAYYTPTAVAAVSPEKDCVGVEYTFDANLNSNIVIRPINFVLTASAEL